MKYACILCAETERVVAPCVLDVPECLGNMSVKFCPVTGDEIDWDRVEVVNTKTKDAPKAEDPRIATNTGSQKLSDPCIGCGNAANCNPIIKCRLKGRYLAQLRDSV